MATTYREAVRPTLIDTAIPSDGRAQALSSLAKDFAQFSRTGNAIVGALNTERGRREGAEAGRTDDPAFRGGMASLTAYGRAYNDSALRSYAIKSDAAAEEAAARLEAEAGTDPDRFRATFGARRDEVLKNAPPEARAAVSEVYDRHMAGAISRLTRAQVAELRQQARGDVVDGLNRGVDRFSQLRASDDPLMQERAEEEQIKLDMIIDGAMEDGTLSDVEGAALKVDATRRAVAQTVTYRFRNEMDNPYGDPVGFIDRVMKYNRTNNSLPPDEEEKLVSSLVAELRERNSLAGMKDSMSDNARQERWIAGNRVASKMLLDNKLTQQTLSRMIEDDQLDPNRATALMNDLQAGSDRPDDSREKFRVATNLMGYEEDEIAENQALSWKTRQELILKRRDEENGWRGTQAGREAADRIDRALGIPPGMNPKMLGEAELEKRDRAMTAWYNAVEALPDDKRAAGILPQAEEIIRTIVRQDATVSAAEIRERINGIKAEMDKGDMDEQEIKDAEKNIARYERALRDAEAKSK